MDKKEDSDASTNPVEGIIENSVWTIGEEETKGNNGKIMLNRRWSLEGMGSPATLEIKKINGKMAEINVETKEQNMDMNAEMIGFRDNKKDRQLFEGCVIVLKKEGGWKLERLEVQDLTKETYEAITNKINSFVIELNNEKYDEALKYIEEIEKLIKKYKNYQFIDVIYHYKGFILAKIETKKASEYFEKKDFSKASEHYEKAIELLPNIFDDLKRTIIKNNEACFNSLIKSEEDKGNYSQARGFRRQISSFVSKFLGWFSTTKDIEYQHDNA